MQLVTAMPDKDDGLSLTCVDSGITWTINIMWSGVYSAATYAFCQFEPAGFCPRTIAS